MTHAGHPASTPMAQTGHPASMPEAHHPASMSEAHHPASMSEAHHPASTPEAHHPASMSEAHHPASHAIPDVDGAFMVHPGLPEIWVWGIFACMLMIAWHALRAPHPATRFSVRLFPVQTLPVIGPIVRWMTASPWPLTGLRIVGVIVFLGVVAAGLWGTPLPERNLATTLTWTVWWSLVVVSVFFLGTAWCSVCPWDTLAGWIVRKRLWRRNTEPAGFEWQPPSVLRTTWPALGLFVGLTWLELGVDVTTRPAVTAMLALLMVVLTTLSMALYKRKAFCRYFCPVGRTLGLYAQLAPVALRPVDPSRCAACQTLECYHGSETIEPCPTALTMGRFSQNTYCTSCGACVLSCPHDAISWHLRPLASEAGLEARPHWDESWFMLTLLTLTTFHGVTMLPQWELFLRGFARFAGDTGLFLVGFSLGMLLCMLLPILLYGVALQFTRQACGETGEIRRFFSRFAFATLPVAFAYHMAHNLGHFAREGRGLGAVFANPMGWDTLPMGAMEKHMRMMDPLLPELLLQAVQSGLMVLGFWLAVRIVCHRGEETGSTPVQGMARLPLLVFLGGMSGLNLWLLAQDMVMRL